ncbi:hypothetical protein BVI434_1290008 [Burkholderia vietnamiensis]|nr:hypothetical protein BVI434_1290008 [Burkholderia vietnamiensis]CAG9230622.1 hypothetical protein BVI1335_750004 [Burkholderia vietnamiensis]
MPLHAPDHRQAASGQRRTVCARPVGLQLDQFPFHQRDDVVAVELDLFRCAMHQEQCSEFVCGQHV